MLLQDIFINRKKELAEIPNGLLLGQSFVIIAPRRYGKTTLIKKIADQIQNDYSVIYVDVMRYAHSLSSLAEAITEECLAQIGIIGKLRNWLKNIDLKLDLKVKFQELEVDAILECLNSGDDYDAFAKALELADKLALQQGKRWLVIYDEIGELQHFNEQAIRVMRSVIQHHKNVNYIFAGSQESLMNKIFISNHGAFYRFGVIYQLQELELADVIAYFKNSLTSVAHDVIDYIVERFNGHPYYTTNIFYRIMQRNLLGDKVQFTLADLQIILRELFVSESHYISDQIKQLNQRKHALAVLIATAHGSPYQITEKISKQSISAVIKKLVIDGYLRGSNGSYQLTDPLLALYLRDEAKLI